MFIRTWHEIKLFISTAWLVGAPLIIIFAILGLLIFWLVTAILGYGVAFGLLAGFLFAFAALLLAHRSVWGWTYAPLIALAIISMAPGIADVAYFPYMRRSPLFVLTFTIYLAALNWPFVVLYFICRRQAKKKPHERSVRLAMWLSLLAMSSASIGVIYLIFSAARMITGGGGSITIELFVALAEHPDWLLWFTAVPILGLIGWLAGYFIAWLTEPSKGAPEPTR